MATVRSRLRAARARRHLRRARVRRAARRSRRGRDQLRNGRRRIEARAPAHSRPDRVVVGLRAGACRCWPSTSRPSPSTCAVRADRAARRAATRSTSSATTSSASSTSSSVDPTIVSGLSSGGVLSAWLSAYAKPGPGARRALRGPAALRLRGPPAHRAEHPPGDRPDLRGVEHVPRRPVVASATGTGCAARRPDELPSGWPILARRRTAAEAQGVRPRVGPRVLDRHVLRVVRPRAHAPFGQGAGAVHPPLPQIDDAPAR